MSTKEIINTNNHPDYRPKVRKVNKYVNIIKTGDTISFWANEEEAYYKSLGMDIKVNALRSRFEEPSKCLDE